MTRVFKCKKTFSSRIITAYVLYSLPTFRLHCVPLVDPCVHRKSEVGNALSHFFVGGGTALARVILHFNH